MSTGVSDFLWDSVALRVECWRLWEDARGLMGPLSEVVGNKSTPRQLARIERLAEELLEYRDGEGWERCFADEDRQRQVSESVRAMVTIAQLAKRARDAQRKVGRKKAIEKRALVRSLAFCTAAYGADLSVAEGSVLVRAARHAFKSLAESVSGTWCQGDARDIVRSMVDDLELDLAGIVMTRPAGLIDLTSDAVFARDPVLSLVKSGLHEDVAAREIGSKWEHWVDNASVAFGKNPPRNRFD